MSWNKPNRGGVTGECKQCGELPANRCDSYNIGTERACYAYYCGCTKIRDYHESGACVGLGK